MAARFTAGELTTVGRLGFDDATTPPWIMVPMGGRRVVSLVDGAGLTLHLRKFWDPDGKGVITFQEQSHVTGRGVALTPVSAGTVFLDAQDGTGRVVASLEITVKAKVTMSTFVHFVFDRGGRSPSVGLDQALHMIEVANKLYLPQANIELVKRDSGPVRLPFNLERGLPISTPAFNAPRSWFRHSPGPLPCIASREPGATGCLPEESQGRLSAGDFKAIRNYQIQCNVLSHVDPNSDYNMFFVSALEQDRLPSITRAFTPSNLRQIEVNACFIPNAGAQGQVLAHEFGHYLLRPKPSFMGPDGHSNGRNDLMQEYPGPDDLKIPKQQANYMNPSGRQYDTW